MAGLMLLERDEGVLAALAVTPSSAGRYLVTRSVTLGGLAAAETVALIWIGFGMHALWPLILAGTATLALIYTSLGAVVGARYRTLNRLLIPASLVVTALLLPLIPHLGLGLRTPFLIHPLEPPLTLIRYGYRVGRPADLLYGLAGSAFWSALAFAIGRKAVARLMRETTTGAA
jgi:hypothetical protein